MCGIIGACIINPSRIKGNIYRIYRNQQNRGKQGFGIAVRHLDGEIERVRTKYEHEIFGESIWNNIQENDIIIFHHRIPTSTPNLPECNHPLSNPSNSIYLVHNGIINGYDELIDSKEFESRISSESRKHPYWKYDEYGNFQWRNNSNEFTDSELCVHRLDDLLVENHNNLEAINIMSGENYFSAFLFLFDDEHKLFFSSNNMNLSSYEYNGNKIISSQPFIKDSKNLENSYGFYGLDEARIYNLDTEYYRPFRKYSNNAYTFGDGSALEEELSNSMYDTIYSPLFKEFKYEHGCSIECETCDMLDDCLSLYHEWKEERFGIRKKFY